jgi:hypothetical protein
MATVTCMRPRPQSPPGPGPLALHWHPPGIRGPPGLQRRLQHGRGTRWQTVGHAVPGPPVQTEPAGTLPGYGAGAGPFRVPRRDSDFAVRPAPTRIGAGARRRYPFAAAHERLRAEGESGGLQTRPPPPCLPPRPWQPSAGRPAVTLAAIRTRCCKQQVQGWGRPAANRSRSGWARRVRWSQWPAQASLRHSLRRAGPAARCHGAARQTRRWRDATVLRGAA